jgi:hypothetical protein
MFESALFPVLAVVAVLAVYLGCVAAFFTRLVRSARADVCAPVLRKVACVLGRGAVAQH